VDERRYQRFLRELTAWALEDPRVIGLVALGSAAYRTHTPDEWSDHDIWVVTGQGNALVLRDDPAWLPDAARIVGWFVETTHGRSAVYEDGHLVEVAVFEDPELEIARANDFRVLYDAGGIEERLNGIAERTASEAGDDAASGHAVGRFVVEMIIGLGRLGRGEFLSANELIRGRAVASLLRAVAGSGQGLLDSLDPHRRFEKVYPDLAERLNQGLQLPLVEVAEALVDVATGALSEAMLTPPVLEVLKNRIEHVRSTLSQ
jgi:lincosamide nucleotidyltransferase